VDVSCNPPCDYCAQNCVSGACLDKCPTGTLCGCEACCKTGQACDPVAAACID
jgi:hypothetical protein